MKTKKKNRRNDDQRITATKSALNALDISINTTIRHNLKKKKKNAKKWDG
jgi:hypothetical protein